MVHCKKTDVVFRKQCSSSSRIILCQKLVTSISGGIAVCAVWMIIYMLLDCELLALLLCKPWKVQLPSKFSIQLSHCVNGQLSVSCFALGQVVWPQCRNVLDDCLLLTWGAVVDQNGQAKAVHLYWLLKSFSFISALDPKVQSCSICVLSFDYSEP